MTRKTDLEALGQHVYGKHWRVVVSSPAPWELLLEFAAAKQLREVMQALEKDMREAAGKLDEPEKGQAENMESLRDALSPQVEREVKTRCANMLKEFLDSTAAKFGEDGEPPHAGEN